MNLSCKDSSFPADALSAIDAALAANGLRKQVRSAVVPGKEFATTYDGPTIGKKKVEDIVAPLAERYGVGFMVDIEESVSFP